MIAFTCNKERHSDPEFGSPQSIPAISLLYPVYKDRTAVIFHISPHSGRGLRGELFMKKESIFRGHLHFRKVGMILNQMYLPCNSFSPGTHENENTLQMKYIFPPWNK